MIENLQQIIVQSCARKRKWNILDFRILIKIRSKMYILIRSIYQQTTTI